MIAVLARVVIAVLVFFNWYGDDDPGPKLASINTPTRITGLILARGGSKGIPNKNMQLLDGFPLIHWSLDAMIKSGAFDEIWVSTDDKEIKNYALKLGVQVHDRAAYTATDFATSMSAVQEFLQVHSAVQSVGLVQCTSPFISPTYLQDAAKRFTSGKCDSVFSVTRTHQLRWAVALNEDFTAKPINFDPKSRPRRQDWQGEFVENGMFYFSPRKLLEKGAFQSQSSCVVEISKHHSIEIDTREDLKVAEIMMKDRGNSKTNSKPKGSKMEL